MNEEQLSTVIELGAGRKAGPLLSCAVPADLRRVT